MNAPPLLDPDSLGKMTATVLSFEELIAPVTVDEFRDRYWEKECLFVSRGNPSFYKSVFSLADVDRCIFARRGDPRSLLTIVPPAQSGQKVTNHAVSEVSAERLYAAFNSGATIRMESAQESWPPIALLVAAISESLNARLNVNFYMTPQDSQGFKLHYDPHDALILQVDGAKEWYLYEPDLPLPLETKIFQELPEVAGYNVNEEHSRLLRKIRIETGDLLYIPRGFPHKAVAAGAPSLHLTVGIHPVYWLEFLKVAIERACAEEPSLRSSLEPGFLTNPEVQERMRQNFSTILGRASERASYDKALEIVSRKIADEVQIPPDGHFAQLAALQQLQVDHLVHRRAGLRFRLDADGATATLRSIRSTIQGPMAILPALKFVCDHRQFRIADLPGLSDSSRVVLVRRLISEGLLTAEPER